MQCDQGYNNAMIHPSNPNVFPAGELRCVFLGEEDLPALQRFFEANPEYFIAVEGQPAGPEAAHEEYLSELPPDCSFGEKWLLGFVDGANGLAGMASLVSDFLAPGVWNLGLFMLATSRHGRGEAALLYRALEAWTAQNGARWLRLGVVAGNVRAERFWEKMGFVDVCRREGVSMGCRINAIRFMMKPLAGGTTTDYLALVERDRPRVSMGASN